MTRDELQRMFPNASASTIRANLQADSAGPAAEPEPAVWPIALATGKAQEADCSRFLVSIVACRKRLLDEDNLVAKFHVDLLRYAGVLPVDSPDRCHIETTQRKAAKGEAETTTITVFKI